MMRHRQQGMTMIGWLIVLVIFGLFALAALRLVPIYLEQFRVSSSLDALSAEMTEPVSRKKEISTFLSKRFDVESIRAIQPQDVTIERKDDHWLVRATYDARAPYIGSLHFIVTTDKSVEIPR
ncbi:MAG: DUF4845 domain-containing protein [Pseudomonadota bacterium]